MKPQSFRVTALIHQFGSRVKIEKARAELHLSCPTRHDIYNWLCRGTPLTQRQISSLNQIADHLDVELNWNEIFNGS